MEVRMVDTSDPSGWKKYAQLKLHGFMFIILIVGSTFGLFAHSVRLQRDAANSIIRSGGVITYDVASEPTRASGSLDVLRTRFRIMSGKTTSVDL